MPFLIRVPALAARRLCLLTLFYLALPLLVFFLGWLRPLWSIPVSLLLLGTLGALTYRGWNRLEGEEVPTSDEWRALIQTLLWTWVPVAFIILQIGAGDFGRGPVDWDNKHNLVLADLVRSPWPVIYRGEGTPASGLMLVYYTAYYLPAAAIGKVLGWSAANVAWQLWTQLGFLLICGWLVAFVGPKVRWLGLLFVGFSGAELLGALLRNADALLHLSHASPQVNLAFDDIPRWNLSPTYYVIYSSNIGHMFWAPQHFLTGWLGIALSLHAWNRTPALFKGEEWDGAWRGSALLGWSLLVLWSPLSALGCLPFLLVLWGREVWKGRRSRQQEKRTSTWALDGAVVATSAVCTGIIALYLAIRIPAPPGSIPQRGEHFEFLLTSLWHSEGLHAVWRVVSFLLVEFGLMYLLVWPRRNEEALRMWRLPLGVALGVLALLPCFIYGYYNDLVTRVSIPSLAILCLAVALFLSRQNVGVSRVRRVGVILLLLCGITNVLAYGRTIGRTWYRGEWHRQRPIENFVPLVTAYKIDPHHLLRQYTSPTDSPFARYFAK